MGIETSHASLEKIQENQLPPDIIELCSQLEINEKQIDKLEWLRPELSEPIILSLRDHASKMKQIPKDESIWYAKVLTGETQQV